MELACDNISPIICIDAEGQENLLHPHVFYESIDEINITTQILNTNLQRGWQGDLVYTVRGFDLKMMEQQKNTQSTHHDVLLVRVRPSWLNGEVIEWEYVFSKH